MDENPTDESAIEVDSILKCLAEHVRGRGEMSATQIRAAEILLRRAPQNEPPAAPADRQAVIEVRNVLVRPAT